MFCSDMTIHLTMRALCALFCLSFSSSTIVPLFQGKQMLFVVGTEKRPPPSVGGASSSVTGIQKWRWLERGPPLPFTDIELLPRPPHGTYIPSKKREARDDIKREIKTPRETCVSFGFSALIIAQRKGHSLTFIIIFQSNELRQRFSRKKGGHRHYRYLNRKSPSSLFTLLLPKAADRGRESTHSS